MMYSTHLAAFLCLLSTSLLASTNDLIKRPSELSNLLNPDREIKSRYSESIDRTELDDISPFVEVKPYDDVMVLRPNLARSLISLRD